LKKQELVAAFVAKLEEDLLTAKAAAQATYEAATHEESKPENEYDTRGLEASYLAGAQAKRVAEIEDVLVMFKTIEFKDFSPDAAIQATSLAEVESNGKKSFVLVLPKGGGESLQYGGRTIQIITPNSLLGEALIDLGEGDVAEIEVGGKMREYEILSVS
jgi:transcription elongation GreA/GreB family factor